jgi:hypothetical protein
VVYYPYQIISADPMVPPAPILRVELLALSVLRLPLLGDRFLVQGVADILDGDPFNDLGKPEPLRC